MLNSKNSIIDIIDLIKKLALVDLVILCDEIAKLYNFNNAKELLEKFGSNNTNQENVLEKKNLTYKLIITEFDASQKMKAINKLKEFLAIGAIQVHKQLQNLPLTIKENMNEKESDALIQDFAQYGITVSKQEEENTE